MLQEPSQVKFWWSISFLCSLVAVWFIQPLLIFLHMMGTVDIGATAGLVEASDTLSSFSPILGLGFCIAIMLAFMALATFAGAKASD